MSRFLPGYIAFLTAIRLRFVLLPQRIDSWNAESMSLCAPCFAAACRNQAWCSCASQRICIAMQLATSTGQLFIELMRSFVRSAGFASETLDSFAFLRVRDIVLSSLGSVCQRAACPMCPLSTLTTCTQRFESTSPPTRTFPSVRAQNRSRTRCFCCPTANLPSFAHYIARS